MMQKRKKKEINGTNPYEIQLFLPAHTGVQSVTLSHFLAFGDCVWQFMIRCLRQKGHKKAEERLIITRHG